MRFWAPFRRISKTTKPWIQAKSRIFNGNSRSVRTAPLKILTPASRVFVLLNSAPKSPKISPAVLRKAYPAVCIQAFSALIQPTLSQIISNSTNKNKDRTFSTTANCLSGFRFSNRKCTRFYTLARNTVTILADKVLPSFLLV